MNIFLSKSSQLEDFVILITLEIFFAKNWSHSQGIVIQYCKTIPVGSNILRENGWEPLQKNKSLPFSGGSLDEYVEITGEPIPLVVTSAIGYLSRFSLRNQGLFRISGSQSEINRFKEAYERGNFSYFFLFSFLISRRRCLRRVGRRQRVQFRGGGLETLPSGVEGTPVSHLPLWPVHWMRQGRRIPGIHQTGETFLQEWPRITTRRRRKYL